jgi:hypothetical protein
MKVAVIGKGTSSIITALTLIKRGHEVFIYFDPDTQHLSVGESTTPKIVNLLTSVLNQKLTDFYQNDVISYKTGIKFINWGKCNRPFLHNFDGGATAFQFETSLFNPYCHKILESSGRVQYFAEKVSSYKIENDQIVINEKSYDFLISCSGWSDEKNEYYAPSLLTVNTGILHAKEFVDEDSTYTLHTATEHGWEFGLPFPKRNITKCGYLYNRNITSLEEIKEKNPTLCTDKKIEWTPKYSKKLIQNKFHAYNGNKLFFFEPLQALSLDYYIKQSENICSFLESRTVENYFECNRNYLVDMWDLQFILSYHYMFGSSHDSDFWIETSKNALDFFSKSPYKSVDVLNEFALNGYLTGDKLIGIPFFSHQDVNELCLGMTGKSINDFFIENEQDNLQHFY